MIAGLSSTPSPLSTATTGRAAREAPAQGVRPVVEARGDYRGDGGNRFAEFRGYTVAGGTLVAAQEEGSQARKPSEEPAEARKAGTASELTDAEQKEVRDLQKRDQEVRAHEQAHQRAGGRHASAPDYEMEQGPDGRSYATGGHVSISTSPVAGDPEATVDKMDIVRKAALAPAEPSGQYRLVAAAATARRADAEAEIAARKAEESKARLEDEGDPDIPGADRPGETGDSTQFGETETEAADAAASGDDAASASGPGSFIEALSQGLGRFAGAALGGVGAVGRLEAGVQPVDGADTPAPTRRTGVDIRV